MVFFVFVVNFEEYIDTISFYTNIYQILNLLQSEIPNWFV